MNSTGASQVVSLCLLGGALLMASPTKAEAREASLQSVHQQLSEVVMILMNGGDYRLAIDPIIDDIQQGEALAVGLSVNPGASYAFVGVCDQHCLDLDLHLLDESGKVVAEDTLMDSTPVIRLDNAVETRYVLQVSMPTCVKNATAPAGDPLALPIRFLKQIQNVSSCYFGVGVFGK